MAICNGFLNDRDKELIEAAQRGDFSGIQSCTHEQQAEFARIMPEIKEKVERMEREFNERLEKDPEFRKEFEKEVEKSHQDMEEYKARQEAETRGEYKVSADHTIDIKNFGLSRREAKETIKTQKDFPQIVNQVTKSIEYTGESEYTTLGNEPGVVVETWEYQEGMAVIKINRVFSEDFLGMPESKVIYDLQKSKMARIERDGQVHGNGHTIYEILMTEEQRDQWTDVCFESKMEGREYVSPYAEIKSKDGKYDEDFCECVVAFKDAPKELEKLDKQKYEFVKEIHTRLAKFSDFIKSPEQKKYSPTSWYQIGGKENE